MNPKAINKRISNARLKTLKQRYRLSDEDKILETIIGKSADEAQKYILAAIHALMSAGEAMSESQTAMVRRTQISKQLRGILYQDANTDTYILNIEEYLVDPDEARAFVETLPEEAKGNLLDILLEGTGESQPGKAGNPPSP